MGISASIQANLRKLTPLRILVWGIISFATFYGTLDFFERFWADFTLSSRNKIIISTVCSLLSVITLADEKILRVIKNQKELQKNQIELQRMDNQIQTITEVLSPVQSQIYEKQLNQSSEIPGSLTQTDGDQLLELGVEAFENNSFKKAEFFLQKALLDYRNSRDEEGQEAVLANLSMVYRWTGRYNEAEVLMKEAIEISESSGESDELAWMYWGLGRIHEAGDEHSTRALNAFMRSKNIAETHEDYDTLIATSVSMATIHINEGENQKAETLLLHILKIAETHNTEALYAIYDRIAYLKLKIGDYSNALTYSELAIESISHQSDKLRLAMVLQTKGSVLIRKKQYRLALDIFQECLTISKEEKDVDLRPGILHNLSLAYSKLGDTKKEEELLLESIEYLRQFSVKPSPESLLNLGYLNIKKGDFETAKKLLDEALEIYRERRIRPGEANALGNIGLLYQKMSNFVDAEIYYNRSLAIDMELGDKGKIAGGLKDLANLMSVKGDKVREAEFFNKAMQIELEIGVPVLEDDFFA